MAETPARYCSNCGHELGDEAQFCPSCGTPVHRAAHVPTPEADVSVPPPPQASPQAGGTGAAATAQPAQPGWGRRHPLLTGCLGIIVVLVLLSMLGAALGGGDGETAGGGGGGGQPAGGGESANEAEAPVAAAGQDEKETQAEKKPKPDPEYKVGQTATAANVEWTVTDAFLTDQLKSGFGTQKSGNFVVVDFTFTNNRNEEVTLDPELHMVLKDSQGREFGSDVDAWEFVPTDLMIFLEPVNPGVSTEGRVVYEVAPDANGFTLTLDDVEMMEDQSAVFNLGNLAPRAYEPASASATASAGAQ